MNFFIDTEFNEGFTSPFFGKPKHMIELISIGMVSEDGRQYYAISNEFDLKAAWNKYQWEDTGKLDLPGINRSKQKVYWLRHNVLFPIWKYLEYKKYRQNDNPIAQEFFAVLDKMPDERSRIDFYIHQMQKFNWAGPSFTLKSLRSLISEFGQSHKQIAKELIDFVAPSDQRFDGAMGYYPVSTYLENNPPNFYAYFADYDWVVFCSIFGRMLDLPKGFPMYCIDLKQMMDEIASTLNQGWDRPLEQITLKDKLKFLKSSSGYPYQANEHDALEDANWNLKLYQFLKGKIVLMDFTIYKEFMKEPVDFLLQNSLRILTKEQMQSLTISLADRCGISVSSNTNWLEKEWPNSKTIAMTSYNQNGTALEVKYRNDNVYQYFDVPMELWDELITAISIGGFLELNVKGKFRYAQVNK